MATSRQVAPNGEAYSDLAKRAKVLLIAPFFCLDLEQAHQRRMWWPQQFYRVFGAVVWLYGLLPVKMRLQHQENSVGAAGNTDGYAEWKLGGNTFGAPSREG